MSFRNRCTTGHVVAFTPRLFFVPMLQTRRLPISRLLGFDLERKRAFREFVTNLFNSVEKTPAHAESPEKQYPYPSSGDSFAMPSPRCRTLQRSIASGLRLKWMASTMPV